MSERAASLPVLRFWELAIRLKDLRRRGWVDRGAHNPESTAAHSWGVAFLAWLLAGERSDLDRERVLLLGLIHDLPEALAGDATPFDAFRNANGGVPPERFRDLPLYSDAAREAKQNAERSALDEMLRGLDDELADSIRSAWLEYEHGETAEARFVRQIDKLETLFQAEHYKRLQPELVIESFWSGTRRDVTDPLLIRLIEALDQENHE